MSYKVLVVADASERCFRFTSLKSIEEIVSSYLKICKIVEIIYQIQTKYVMFWTPEIKNSSIRFSEAKSENTDLEL